MFGITISQVGSCPKLRGERTKQAEGNLKTPEGHRNRPKVPEAPEGLQKDPKVICKPEGSEIPSE